MRARAVLLSLALLSRAVTAQPQTGPPSPEAHFGFRLGSDGVEGVFSDGRYTVKFRVETSAKTAGQQAAVVAALNEWLTRHLGKG